MSRFAIVGANTLAGQELKETLERKSSLWSHLELVTWNPEDDGLVSEVAGEATLVRHVDAANLENTEILFLCPRVEGPLEGGQAGEQIRSIIDRSTGGTTTIVLTPPQPIEGAAPVVAGVNLTRAKEGAVLVSPDPVVVAMAHLLHPLAALELEEAIAWVVRPASIYGQKGIDELLDQFRGLLSFQTDYPREVFGAQLAMSLLPSSDLSDQVSRDLRSVLGPGPELSVRTIQGANFHSLALSLLVRLGGSPTAELVSQTLGDNPHIEVAAEPEKLGPSAASGTWRILLGQVEAHSEQENAFWLWAAMDNLTLGAAGNAVAIAEALLGASN